jgi:hypothetical protein
VPPEVSQITHYVRSATACHARESTSAQLVCIGGADVEVEGFLNEEEAGDAREDEDDRGGGPALGIEAVAFEHGGEGVELGSAESSGGFGDLGSDGFAAAAVWATTARVWSRTWMVAPGCAVRLRYQAGWRGAPPTEATMT